MNQESSTSYDLEERLLNYGASIIMLTKDMGRDYAERHIANQLLRSGTAPLSHHGEAQGAESHADFIHKLSIGLKELRESERWIKLILRAKLLNAIEKVEHLAKETEELIRIFVTSIRTAKSNKDR